MGFFGTAHGWGVREGGGEGPPPQNLSHISYKEETWHSYNLPKEIAKTVRITRHTPWVLLTSASFYRKSANFSISRNRDIDSI